MEETFYDRWLRVEDKVREAFTNSPVIARDAETPWVATRQDAKVKLMIARERGFPTMGSIVLKAEIPSGWHTGAHAHGEESMHILSGEGFSLIEGRRYPWRAGSTLQIPYRARHQHFNTGPEPVLYVSGMCLDLEEFVHLGAVHQFEYCGPNEPGFDQSGEAAEDEYLGDRRVVIHLDEVGTDGSGDPTFSLEANQNQHYRNLFLVVPGNGFKAESVAITHIFEEPPGYHGGRHKHLEAVLYVLEGEGFTEIEGIKHRWQAGDVMHVPPAMFEHEHYNDTGKAYRLLRIQFGIRFWFTDIWPEGYTSRRVYDEQGNPLVAGTLR